MSYLKVDKLQLDIIINGDTARKELYDLEGQAKGLRNEMKKWPKDSDEWVAAFEKLKVVETRMDAIKKEIGLTGATMKELKQRARELQAALNNIDPRHPMYAQLQAELTQVNGRMRELKGTANETHFSISKMADGFNRYMGILAAGAAVITGIVMSIKSARQASMEFESSKSNLSALTGLKGEDLDDLAQSAKDLSTTTLDSGVKITQGAKEILDAYTKMGSARPELLKNKEALKEVTEQALILNEAGKLKTAEQGIEAVAAAMNQFNLEASQSNRIINVFAAGSLEGSSEISDLTDSMKNAGTVAADSNMTLEQTVAILEVLGEKQLKGEEAGTKLRGALLKLKDAGMGYASGNFVLRDALEETNQKLSQLSSNVEKDTLKQKLFGAENVTVGTILLNNIEKYDTLTKKVTGTNIAIEQAITNTNNESSAYEQAKNRFNLVAIELGDRLVPVLTAATGWTTKLMNGSIMLFNFIGENRGVIIGLVGAYLVLNAAKIKNLAITAFEHTLGKQGIALWVQTNIIKKASIVITELHTATVEKSTIAQKAAAAATVLWNNALKLFGGPVGAIIAGVIALGTAIAIYASRASEATRAQKMLNEVELNARKSIVDQRVELDHYLSVAKNDSISKNERYAAIKKLNEISPEYLGNLTLENINTQEAAKATKAYTDNLLEMAMVQARIDMIKEKQTRILEINSEVQNKSYSVWDTFMQRLKGYGNVQEYHNSLIRKGLQLKKEIEALNSQSTPPQNKESEKTPEQKAQEAKANAKKEVDLKTSLARMSNDQLQEIADNSADDFAKKQAKKILKERAAQEKANKEKLKQEQQFQALILELMQGGYEKEIYEENQKHKEKLELLKGNNKAIELENVRHKRVLDALQKAQVGSDPKSLARSETDEKLAKQFARVKLEEEARAAAQEELKKLEADKLMGKVSPEDMNSQKLEIELAYLGQLYLIRKKSGEDTVQLEKDIVKKREDLEYSFYERKKKLQVGVMALNAAQAAQTATSFREMGSIILNSIRSSIKAYLAEAMAGMIAREFATKGILGAITSAAGAALVSVAFETLVPQFAAGNIPVRGMYDGKIYDANQDGNARTGLFTGPTLLNSAGGFPILVGEKMPEIVIDGARTRNIMLNYPQLFEAIRAVPQFAAGNVGSKEIYKESMFTDPRMIELLDRINAKLDGVSLLTLHDKLTDVQYNKNNLTDKFNG